MLNYNELRQLTKQQRSKTIREQNLAGVILVICLIMAFIFVVMAILWAKPAHASTTTIDPHKATLAILGEAENQGALGMLYVACAINNRGTLHGVYGYNALRVRHHKYTEAVLAQAKYAWELATTHPDMCAPIDGATHWENIRAFGRPYWVASMVEKFRYRDHVFYRAKGDK